MWLFSWLLEVFVVAVEDRVVEFLKLDDIILNYVFIIYIDCKLVK